MLRTRIFTAVFLVAFVGLMLFKATDFVWQVFAMSVAAVAAWEWFGFSTNSNSTFRFFYALLAPLVIWFALPLFDVSLFLALALIQLLTALFFVTRFQLSKGERPQEKDCQILVLGLLNISLFTISFILFRETFSPILLLLTMMVIWAIDTGAYFSGRRFGKNKLAQYVSPGKTWEGVYGGALLSFIVAFAGIKALQLDVSISPWFAAIVLTLIAVISVYGDLFESVLKRQAGVKDSGKILPGHGGVLDRLDSLILSLPLFYLAWLSVLAS